jgi:hypothetical protein
MAITYRAAASDSVNGVAGSVVLHPVIPTTVQAGDGMIMVYSGGADATTDLTASGWTLQKSGSSSANVWNRTWTKIATSSDPGSTVAIASAAAKCNALLVAYSGVDTSTPVAYSDITTEGISQTTHAAPTLNPATNGRLIEILSLRDTSTAASTAWTPPASTSVRASVNKPVTAQLVGVLADSAGALPGGTSYGGSWTVDAASQSAVMVALWLNPAATGTTPQALRPGSDVTTTGWTVTGGTGSKASAVDEPTADDTDYVQSPANPNGTQPIEFLLAPGVPPGSLTGITLSLRMQTVSALSDSVVITLRQGATVISTWTETGVTSAWQTFVYSVTPTEAAQITDWTDLRVRIAPTIS